MVSWPHTKQIEGMGVSGPAQSEAGAATHIFQMFPGFRRHRTQKVWVLSLELSWGIITLIFMFNSQNSLRVETFPREA